MARAIRYGWLQSIKTGQCHVLVKATPYMVHVALDAPAPSRWPPRRS
jgi:hypothetical protein